MKTFINYIDEMMAQLKVEEQELISTDRKDEANFIRIKLNICDICKTIYIVSEKKYSGEALKEEYLRQLTRLPENWKISYDKAKENNDVPKIVIEEMKLEVLQQIKAKYEELGE